MSKPRAGPAGRPYQPGWGEIMSASANESAKKSLAPWRRLGLRGRLFAAFGAVAATTVLASGTALVSYDRLGRSLEVVTGTSLPHVTRASNIGQSASDVVAAAQALLAAANADERTRTLAILDAARRKLAEAVAALPDADAAKLKQTAGLMSDNLDKLARSIAERQTLGASRVALVKDLRNAHQKLAEKLAPMADDAAFSLTLGLQSAAEKGDADAIKQTLGALADNDLVSLQAILELRAEANLVLGILVEAADLPSKDVMPPVRDRFVAAASHLDKGAAALKDAAITKLAADLVSFGRRDGNVFALKDKEFAGAVAGVQVVTENRALADELVKEVAALRMRSEAAASAAAETSEGEIGRGRIILIGLALASLVTAGALGWLYVGRSVSRRLSGL